MSHGLQMTILLAEDDRSAREVTTLVLEAEGYRVIPASNGTLALDLLRQDVSVDLLLSDIRMPGGIDGLELARRAKMSRPVQILLMSADPRGSFGGFPNDVAFLGKPYDRRSLLGAVDALLQSAGH